jgi:hypothetical protein
VGVAPTVVTIVTSAGPHEPPRSQTLVDTPLPICAVDSAAEFGPGLPGLLVTIVAIESAPRIRTGVTRPVPEIDCMALL